jgi:hypothetical protein
MTLDELHSALSALGEATRTGTSWRLLIDGQPITCLADETRDELRLVLPVGELAARSEDERERLLAANFHASLQARFALFEGVVVAMWGGRLSALDAEALGRAVREVVALQNT